MLTLSLAELLAADPEFWARVDITAPDGCWIWTASRNLDGYGAWRGERAHRHAFTLAYGSIPPGALILHECDRRACCNPAHLRAGTQAENMRDKFARKRHTDFRRKLTPADVMAMRASGATSTALASRYGITPGHARNCVNGNKWPRLAEIRQLELPLFIAGGAT